MGCCNKPARVVLPIVVTAGPPVRPVRKQRVLEKKPKSIKRVVQDHCIICGDVWKFHPAYVHVCKGPQTVTYQEHRKSVCTTCSHNKNGVCIPLKTLMKVRKPDENPPCLAEVSWNQPGWKCPLDLWQRCLWRCSKCGSQSFDEKGLTRCPVCEGPKQPACVAGGKLFYRQTPDISIPTPTSNIAIITAATGWHDSYFKYIKPFQEAYAKKVGADYHVITDDLFNKWPLANKWRMQSIAKHYDRVLWLDADVIPMPQAPNIFNATPSNMFAVQDEWPYRHDKQDINNEGTQLCKQLKLPQKLINWQPNAGVMVIPKTELHRYDPPNRPVTVQWVLDQHLLAIHLPKEEAFLLDDVWNWAFIRKEFWEGLSNAYFIHLNGSRPAAYREVLSKRITEGNFERIDPPTTANFHPAWYTKP